MQQPLVKHADTVTRINVTPIIDVALVLVIILLITAPMISVSDMEVDLPPAQTLTPEDEVRMSITLGKDGAVAIDDQSVPRRNLTSALSSKLEESKNENILVVVRADVGVPYKSIKEILKDTQEAGAKRVAIATRQRGRMDR